MHYRYPQKVLFKHCDPAGIVFYPRYFEMISDAVESLFSDVLGWPFESMHPDASVPTASFNVRFKQPCRHGDQLELRVTLTHLGRSSLSLTTQATRAQQMCFEAEQVLVCVDDKGRPAPWPEHVASKIKDVMEARK